MLSQPPFEQAGPSPRPIITANIEIARHKNGAGNSGRELTPFFARSRIPFRRDSCSALARLHVAGHHAEPVIERGSSEFVSVGSADSHRWPFVVRNIGKGRSSVDWNTSLAGFIEGERERLVGVRVSSTSKEESHRSALENGLCLGEFELASDFEALLARTGL